MALERCCARSPACPAPLRQGCCQAPPPGAPSLHPWNTWGQKPFHAPTGADTAHLPPLLPFYRQQPPFPSETVLAVYLPLCRHQVWKAFPRPAESLRTWTLARSLVYPSGHACVSGLSGSSPTIRCRLKWGWRGEQSREQRKNLAGQCPVGARCTPRPSPQRLGSSTSECRPLPGCPHVTPSTLHKHNLFSA